MSDQLVHADCPDCDGTGWAADEWGIDTRCGRCDGLGEILDFMDVEEGEPHG